MSTLSKKEKLPCCNRKMMQHHCGINCDKNNNPWQPWGKLVLKHIYPRFRSHWANQQKKASHHLRCWLVKSCDCVPLVKDLVSENFLQSKWCALPVSLKTRMLESHTILLVASREQERKQCWTSMACWSRHDSWHDGFCWRVVCSQKNKQTKKQINIQIAAVRNKKINK